MSLRLPFLNLPFGVELSAYKHNLATLKQGGLFLSRWNSGRREPVTHFKNINLFVVSVIKHQRGFLSYFDRRERPDALSFQRFPVPAIGHVWLGLVQSLFGTSSRIPTSGTPKGRNQATP